MQHEAAQLLQRSEQRMQSVQMAAQGAQKISQARSKGLRDEIKRDRSKTSDLGIMKYKSKMKTIRVIRMSEIEFRRGGSAL